MKKLHLGCGKRLIDGWTNIDIFSDNPIVVNDDVSKLTSVVNESADIIYASHVLEHFGRYETEEILKTWYKKLKPGGLLRIAVPDFEAVCKRYLSHGNIHELLGFLNGGQRNQYDYHKVNFDFLKIETHLKNVGFGNIRRYEWSSTEHSAIDDYSQSYLPHMDKENGTLMSLNVEAIKI
jgi:predicted SAM-dependent methyltransferase